MGQHPIMGLNSKINDPLIKAEADKRIREHRAMYQQEFQKSIEDIDQKFLLKKKELVKQNEEEIERERLKWDKYKKDQEKKIKDEIEADVDAKISNFKDDLKKEEDREIKKI